MPLHLNELLHPVVAFIYPLIPILWFYWRFKPVSLQHSTLYGSLRLCVAVLSLFVLCPVFFPVVAYYIMGYESAWSIMISMIPYMVLSVFVILIGINEIYAAIYNIQPFLRYSTFVYVIGALSYYNILGFELLMWPYLPDMLTGKL